MRKLNFLLFFLYRLQCALYFAALLKLKVLIRPKIIGEWYCVMIRSDEGMTQFRPKDKAGIQYYLF